MQHGRKERVGDLVPGYIQHSNTGLTLTPLEVSHNLQPAGGSRLADARRKVVAFLEIDVNDMVAAAGAFQRHSPAVDIDPIQRWDFTGQRNDVADDVFEIP